MLEDLYRVASKIFPAVDFGSGQMVIFSRLSNSDTNFLAKLVHVEPWPSLGNREVDERTVPYSEVADCPVFSSLLETVWQFSLLSGGLYVTISVGCGEYLQSDQFEQSIAETRKTLFKHAIQSHLAVEPKIVGEIQRERLLGPDGGFETKNNKIRYHLVVQK